jgi:hypothetical protein
MFGSWRLTTFDDIARFAPATFAKLDHPRVDHASRNPTADRKKLTIIIDTSPDHA